MEAVDDQVNKLKQQIADTQSRLADLHEQLQQAEARAKAAQDLEIAYQGGVPHAWQQEAFEVFSHLFPTAFDPPSVSTNNSGSSPNNDRRWPLEASEYRRYGRQLIMPEVGLQGQLRLKTSKVLVVGAGGLGCPAAAYLAGAGVGTLGIVDGDVVELSNLHRQIAHSTARVGKTKVESAISYLNDLNPKVKYVSHSTHLTPEIALDLFKQYDLVLDCTDHPTSRYLISDTCILAGRPLVSASALRTEAQLTVLNNPPRPPGDATGGPCYRCIWPTPPPPETVLSCGEGGILGPVVGVMGVLQSLEALKILIAGAHTVTDDNQFGPTTSPSLLMFSAYSPTPFRTVRLRSRRPDCAACSAQATVTADSLTSGSMDYVAFCGATQPVTILADSERVDAADFASHMPHETSNVSVVDVRNRAEFDLCNVDGSINIPWSDFPMALKNAELERPPWLDSRNVVVVCKLGNDSQMAVRMIKDRGLASGNVVDIRDGFRAWRQKVDTSWPDY